MGRIEKCMKAAVSMLKADLVLKNAWIVNVFTQCIHKGDIAIVEDKIVGIGEYSGVNEIDCQNYYVSPGFIDAHVHIESSRVIPEAFSSILIKKGVTTCIADPHEIANVLGEEGIRFMLENSREALVDIFFMLPSCVPAVEYEDNGAILQAENLERFIPDSKVLGLGEVMDVPSVIYGERSMNRKLSLFKNSMIDGHCPQIPAEWLNAYILAGIRTDHECSTPEEAGEKVKRGMYVMLREGSAARNLKCLLPAVNDENYHRFLFCTDDKDITDLEKEGSIDHNIRTAISCGMSPLRAISIATINAAQCYGLRNKGAIAPGYDADLVILKDLESIKIEHVIKSGKLHEKCKYKIPDINLSASMNIEPVKEEMFRVMAASDRINVIGVIKGSIETLKVKREAVIKDSIINGINSDDSLKIAVFERHKRTGKYSVGFIEGMGLKNCSIAQTIAHDSHNIIVVGDRDSDMAYAVNRVIEMKGGIAVVSSGCIVGEISLPAAGLMTNEEPEAVIQELNRLNEIITKFKGISDANTLLTLGFMALPVIPELKITARGLYDFGGGRFISLFCSADDRGVNS